MYEGEYLDPADCIADGIHLTDCDDSGYCNFCGEQPTHPKD